MQTIILVDHHEPLPSTVVEQRDIESVVRARLHSWQVTDRGTPQLSDTPNRDGSLPVGDAHSPGLDNRVVRRIDIDAVNLFLVQVAQELESMEVLTVDNRVKRSRARRPLKSSSGLQCGESRLAKLPNYNKILRMSIRFLAARIAEICLSLIHI